MSMEKAYRLLSSTLPDSHAGFETAEIIDYGADLRERSAAPLELTRRS